MNALRLRCGSFPHALPFQTYYHTTPPFMHVSYCLGIFVATPPRPLAAACPAPAPAAAHSTGASGLPAPAGRAATCTTHCGAPHRLTAAAPLSRHGVVRATPSLTQCALARRSPRAPFCTDAARAAVWGHTAGPSWAASRLVDPRLLHVCRPARASSTSWSTAPGRHWGVPAHAAMHGSC